MNVMTGERKSLANKQILKQIKLENDESDSLDSTPPSSLNSSDEQIGEDTNTLSNSDASLSEDTYDQNSIEDLELSGTIENPATLARK